MIIVPESTRKVSGLLRNALLGEGGGGGRALEAFLETFRCCSNSYTMFIASKEKHKLPNDPIRTRSKYMAPAPEAGKRVRASRDWFEFYFWLVEKVAGDFLTNHRAK